MKLSVVLATHNEETYLPDCLESVRGWCDEIVLVDGTSGDKTVEIAKRYKARIKITPNVPLFHINKQKAIDMAKGEWILQLDADERVTPELREEISRQLDQHEIQGFWIPRKNYFLGRFLMKGGVYPDYTLRLYRRGKGKLPQKDVHEQAQVEGKVGYLKAPLVHMSDATFERYLSRFKRYTDLIATQMGDRQEARGLSGFTKNVIIKPLYWFFLTYIRHKGFLDSWQGFLFSFFSALRYPVAYFKYLAL